MQALIAEDLTDRDDIDQTLDRLTAVRGALPKEKVPSEQKPDLPPIIARLADPKYAENRRGYLQDVAEAGDAGAPITHLTAKHFGGVAQAHGGTHRQIERL